MFPALELARAQQNKEGQGERQLKTKFERTPREINERQLEHIMYTRRDALYVDSNE